MEVAGNLILQLFIKIAFEFADLAASQARDVDVVPRAVRFVIVPVSAKVQQIQFVNEPYFFRRSIVR